MHITFCIVKFVTENKMHTANFHRDERTVEKKMSENELWLYKTLYNNAF